ncbi:MAG TPA: S9 family peptidase, partial [Acidothermaceae bacterium]
MSSEPDWQARFRAARMSLPMWAWAQPSRNAYVSNASGVFEIYSWDRDTAATEQITDRAAGTHRGAIDPSGEWIWWFDDADGSEFGSWRRTPFTGGVSHEAVVGLAPSYSSGLCLGLDGLSVVGCSTDAGASVYATREGGAPVLLYAHPQDASVAALSRDGALVAIEHSEHGDSRHMALRVLRVADGSTVAELWDGPGLGIDGVAFAPVVGDHRMIARHERLGRWTPFIWDVAT